MATGGAHTTEVSRSRSPEAAVLGQVGKIPTHSKECWRLQANTLGMPVPYSLERRCVMFVKIEWYDDDVEVREVLDRADFLATRSELDGQASVMLVEEQDCEIDA